jgi:nitrate/TMAO reductase-like tetraheme cytochrome c subunit
VRKHWKKVIVVLVVLILIAVVVGYFIVAAMSSKAVAAQQQSEQTRSPAGECAQCHEMLPDILTWQVTVHDKFACTVCHINKKAANYVGKHQSENYTKPIKIIDAIPNSACLQCHTEGANRTASPTGDLLIPHQIHLDAGVACVKCHYGVAHAKIAERDLTSIVADSTKYEAWNLDIAKKVATRPFIMPSMWTCIDCHKQANVSRKCSTCHTKIPTLPSHDQPTWRTEHGVYARNGLQECINCHATPGVPISITPSTGDATADFARAQQFCYNCHQQRPEMHGKTMAPIHSILVTQRGPQNCLTCHDLKQPESNAKVTRAYCNQCHWFNSVSDIQKHKKTKGK